VGLHALQIARMAGAWVIAVDVNEARLELAKSLGADALIDARRRPFHETVRQLTDGQGVDVVMEFVANQDTVPSRYHSVKRVGRPTFTSCAARIPRTRTLYETVRIDPESSRSRANTKLQLK